MHAHSNELSGTEYGSTCDICQFYLLYPTTVCFNILCHATDILTFIQVQIEKYFQPLW